MARDKTERIRHGKVPTAASRPYASVPASQLATGRVRKLCGDAVRILMMAHANWTPQGGAVVPVAGTAKTLHLGKSTVIAAIAELRAAELLTLRRAAVRPGAMGPGAAGAAAIYNVAAREPKKGHNVFEWGDRHFQGSWRIYCADLRGIAAKLTGNEARILVALVLPCHRDRHGSPQNPIIVSLSGRVVAAVLPGMCARSADAAIAGLVSKGMIALVAAPSGSLAGTFAPTGTAASSISRRGNGRGRTPAPTAAGGSAPSQSANLSAPVAAPLAALGCMVPYKRFQNCAQIAPRSR